ncbi:hypothetical protein [Shimia sp. SDUM112013]|uniref:hypothetical protein n=1 Tax=Shimia sp. SDUM112013 TaxID=3136160 RepID=UPI0032F07E75
MSEISDLESRISAAMDRIGRSLEGLSGGAGAAEETEALRQQLEDEKTALAQLETRNTALAARQEELEAEVTSLRAEAEASRSYVDAGQAELEKAQQEAEEAKAQATAAQSEIESLRADLEQAQADAAEKAAQVEAESEAAATAATLAPIDLDENRDAITQLSKRLRRLRITSRQLREANNLLREAAEKNLPDHTLVNKALQAELNNLKAERDVERAEMDVIVGSLGPMLEQDAPEGEAKDA